MKINGLALLTGVLCLLLCVLHLFANMPSAASEQNESSEINTSVDLNIPTLREAVVSSSIKLMEKEKPRPKAETNTKKVQKKKVSQSFDEVKVNGKLVKLIGVFESEANIFAVLGQRDSDSGRILDKVELKRNDEFSGYKVDGLTLEVMTLTNGKNKIVFEMYKKPLMVKG